MAGASEHHVRKTLAEVELRLAVAYATCVTVEQALMLQNSDYSREMAVCLRWGVGNAISHEQARLRKLASSIARHSDALAAAV